MVDAFFQWCEQQRDRVLDGSPMADAIHSACNQHHALERLLDDARLPLSNDISERHLRRQAKGAQELAVRRLEGRRAGEHDLRFAAGELPDAPPRALGVPARSLLCLAQLVDKRVLELAPAYWPQTLADPDVRRRLESRARDHPVDHPQGDHCPVDRGGRRGPGGRVDAGGKEARNARRTWRFPLVKSLCAARSRRNCCVRARACRNSARGVNARLGFGRPYRLMTRELGSDTK